MKKKREIGRRRALENNFYACRLLRKICPSLVGHLAISRFLGYFEWLFYSAFFMRYVINSLEAGDSFGSHGDGSCGSEPWGRFLWLKMSQRTVPVDGGARFEDT